VRERDCPGPDGQRHAIGDGEQAELVMRAPVAAVPEGPLPVADPRHDGGHAGRHDFGRRRLVLHDGVPQDVHQPDVDDEGDGPDDPELQDLAP